MSLTGVSYLMKTRSEQEDERYADLGRQYSAALTRLARDTLENLLVSAELGWTRVQFRHWVDTGEMP